MKVIPAVFSHLDTFSEEYFLVTRIKNKSRTQRLSFKEVYFEEWMFQNNRHYLLKKCILKNGCSKTIGKTKSLKSTFEEVLPLVILKSGSFQLYYKRTLSRDILIKDSDQVFSCHLPFLKIGANLFYRTACKIETKARNKYWSKENIKYKIQTVMFSLRVCVFFNEYNFSMCFFKSYICLLMLCISIISPCISVLGGVVLTAAVKLVSLEPHCHRNFLLKAANTYIFSTVWRK